MIPWKIKNNGKNFLTWNPDISKALVALLPPPFATNRERLSGILIPLIARRVAETLD